ncbi:MAG: prepilin peptidase [bacterium]|nr:prepilin peptidase [bacterium]
MQVLDGAFGGAVTSYATILVGVTACGTASLTDIRERRVPNWLTIPTALLALLLSALRGVAAFETAVVLVAAALLLGALVHGSGLLGGGDVKLLIGVAILVGFPDCLWLLLYTALAGGALAVATALAQGRLRVVCLRAAGVLTALLTRTAVPRRSSGATPAGERLPYAVAVALGFVTLVLSETYLPALRVHL